MMQQLVHMYLLCQHIILFKMLMLPLIEPIAAKRLHKGGSNVSHKEGSCKSMHGSRQAQALAVSDDIR